MSRKPLRVAVVGIDGSGKSSTTWRALELLGAEGLIICKPGRNAWVQRGPQREYYLPAISKFFEDLFRRVDASRRRGWISASRAAFIAYQRWLEPQMLRRHQPKLLLNTRCMIIDPAIYGDLYWRSRAGWLSSSWLTSKLPAMTRGRLQRSSPPRCAAA